MSGRGAPDVIGGFLEVQLAAETQHTIGAGEGVADQRLCRGDALGIMGSCLTLVSI